MPLTNAEKQKAHRRRMAEKMARMREALKPFADCVDHIDKSESDDEWAKFRLTIRDYRRAYAALNPTDPTKS